MFKRRGLRDFLHGHIRAAAPAIPIDRARARRCARAAVLAMLVCGTASMARAADMGGSDPAPMAGMDMGPDTVMTAAPRPMTSMTSMVGAYGTYGMTRDASGTAWQPDTTPLEGVMSPGPVWMTMAHGDFNTVYDHQGGARGATETFSEGNLMFMAQRALGDATWALRAMGSIDPTMGKGGYPLLFASGETADGKTPLIDRQHPHDLIMELSTSYSAPVGERSSAFVYVGLPGEPALGPPAFMHRFSGMDDPEAPISHHWFDSTHITFGVATVGYVIGNVKVDLSWFNGREPDQYRYNIETRAFDSTAERVSWNPNSEWSLQVSQGKLKSPEQLAPSVSITRTTASAIYQHTFGEATWGSTVAWGDNRASAGGSSAAVLLESTLRLNDCYTLFGRAERLGNGELLSDDVPSQATVLKVAKGSLGGIDDFYTYQHLRVGVGALASRYAHSAALDAAYGHPTSYMIFVRMKLVQ